MPNNTFRTQRKLLKGEDDSTKDWGNRGRTERARKVFNKGICVDLTSSTATSTEINLCKKKRRKEVLLSWEIPTNTVHSDSKPTGFAVSPVNCKSHRSASMLCAVCKLSKIEAPHWSLFIQNQLRTTWAGFYWERLFSLNMTVSLQAVCGVCCSLMQMFSVLDSYLKSGGIRYSWLHRDVLFFFARSGLSGSS